MVMNVNLLDALAENELLLPDSRAADKASAGAMETSLTPEWEKVRKILWVIVDLWETIHWWKKNVLNIELQSSYKFQILISK